MVSAPCLTSLQTLTKLRETPTAELDKLTETLLRLRYGDQRATRATPRLFTVPQVAEHINISVKLAVALLRRHFYRQAHLGRRRHRRFDQWRVLEHVTTE